MGGRSQLQERGARVSKISGKMMAKPTPVRARLTLLLSYRCLRSESAGTSHLPSSGCDYLSCGNRRATQPRSFACPSKGGPTRLAPPDFECRSRRQSRRNARPNQDRKMLLRMRCPLDQICADDCPALLGRGPFGASCRMK
jgi:hypothetical protein